MAVAEGEARDVRKAFAMLIVTREESGRFNAYLTFRFSGNWKGTMHEFGKSIRDLTGIPQFLQKRTFLRSPV